MYVLGSEDSGMPCIQKAQVSKFINPPTAFEHVFWHISPQDLSKPDKTFSHCKILGLLWDCMQQLQLTQYIIMQNSENVG